MEEVSHELAGDADRDRFAVVLSRTNCFMSSSASATCSARRPPLRMILALRSGWPLQRWSPTGLGTSTAGIFGAALSGLSQVISQSSSNTSSLSTTIKPTAPESSANRAMSSNSTSSRKATTMAPLASSPHSSPPSALTTSKSTGAIWQRSSVSFLARASFQSAETAGTGSLPSITTQSTSSSSSSWAMKREGRGGPGHSSILFTGATTSRIGFFLGMFIHTGIGPVCSREAESARQGRGDAKDPPHA
mmetsp:Transcript_116285/g.340201  ORF Transcript_116285/g.340201 Transcript_116285/m.340201 type:complete len:248 (-) Transcript_116285:18-761(-)